MDGLDRIREIYFEGQAPEGDYLDLESLSEPARRFLLHPMIGANDESHLHLAVANEKGISLRDLYYGEDLFWNYVIEKTCDYRDAAGIEYSDMKGNAQHQLLFFDLKDGTKVEVIFGRVD